MYPQEFGSSTGMEEAGIFMRHFLSFFFFFLLESAPLRFPRWLSGKESACRCRIHQDLQLDPWVLKIPWWMKWQPTLVFLPEKSHGQRSLAGSMGSQRVRHEWGTEHACCPLCWRFQWISVEMDDFFLGFPDSSVGKESDSNARDPGLIPGSGRSAGEGINYAFRCSWGSPVAQLVKNPPAMHETWVWSLGWEAFLQRKATAIHSSILSWRILWTV